MNLRLLFILHDRSLYTAMGLHRSCARRRIHHSRGASEARTSADPAGCKSSA